MEELEKEEAQSEVVSIDKKKIFIVIGAIVLTLVAIYLGLSVYFMSHFYFGTKINGVDVSGASIESAKETVQQAMSNYELVITEKDGTTDTIVGSEIELLVQWNDDLEGFLDQQNGFAWPIKIFMPEIHNGISRLSYNEAKLDSVISGLSCMASAKQIMPQDARVSEYSEETGYALVPAVEGTAVNKEVLETCIKGCINNMERELVLVDRQVYYLPNVLDTDEDLLAAIDQLNLCASAVITYQVGSSTQVLDKETFIPWLYVDENLQVAVNAESLEAYVKELADTYNTCYDAKKLKTSYGSTVTITNSHYGWKVDQEAEKAAITADIMAGTTVTRDLNYSMTANSHEGNDFGDSYVEINLTSQELFLYVDGSLILKTEFVSGDAKKGWSTPGGAFGLTYKERDATLNGDNYSTPVDYWMPFNGNIGMHDATWRGSFGGSIYKRNGSHGCINLPWSSAKTIFSYVDSGFPVLVYHLNGTQTAKGIAQDQAYEMIDIINAIGTVTLESEPAITSARTKYDGLSDLAKKYVTNYQKLLDAEAALAKLKEPVEPEEPTESEIVEALLKIVKGCL